MADTGPDLAPLRDPPAEPETWRDTLGTIVSVVAALAFLAYPLLVYAGLRQWSPRTAALVLLVVFVPLAIRRAATLSREDLTTVAFIPFVTVTLIATSAALDRAGLVLAAPVAVNLLLLLTFGATLRRGRPMVERFARLQDPDLTDAEVAWCRLWTAIWTGFFLLNGTLAALLTVAPLKLWALYNGLGAYGVIGLLFATEFVIRKLRFRRFGSGPVDRLFRRLAGEGRQ